MAIRVDYYDHDGVDYELTIADPRSINDLDIDNLINNQQGCVSGCGGNSLWELHMQDNKYVVEFLISGAFGDSIFKYTIYNIDIINELLNLIKEINHLTLNHIKYESISDHITVTSGN